MRNQRSFLGLANICGTVIKGTTALRLSQDRGSHMSYRHSDVPGNTLASSLSATPWRLSCRVGIAPCVQLVFPSWDRLKRSSRSGTILPQSTKNVTPPSPGAVTKARIARYSKDPKSEPRIRDRIRKNSRGAKGQSEDQRSSGHQIGPLGLHFPGRSGKVLSTLANLATALIKRKHQPGKRNAIRTLTGAKSTKQNRCG